MNKSRLLGLGTLLLILSSCNNSPDTEREVPHCIESIWYETDNNYISICSYEWKGETVYLFNSTCCDLWNDLRDENCNYLCSPTGGENGFGDGTCPEFFDEATDKKVLFE